MSNFFSTQDGARQGEVFGVIAAFIKQLRIFLQLSKSDFYRYSKFLSPSRPERSLLYGIAKLLERESPRVSESFLHLATRVFNQNSELLLQYAYILFRNGKLGDSFRIYETLLTQNLRPIYFLVPESLAAYFQLCEKRHPSFEFRNRLMRILETRNSIDQLVIFAKALTLTAKSDMSREFLNLCIEKSKLISSEKNIFELVAVQDLAEATCLEDNKELVAASKRSYLEPIVFESSAERRSYEVDIPTATVGKLKNVDLLGAFNLYTEGCLICYEPAGHPSHGKVAGNWQYISGLDGYEQKALLTFSYRDRIHFKEGVLIGGRSSTNYFHWLIEYLPRLLTTEMVPNLRQIPIVIDKNLAPQQLEALSFFCEDQQFIEFDHHQIFHFDSLFVPSLSTYLPDRYDLDYSVGGAVSPPHIRFVRDRIFSKLQINSPNEPLQSEGRKIYLTRKSNRARRLENESEIEAYLRTVGFEVIYPERLCFEEQVRLFNEAAFIASPGGAALANVIFCRPGTQLIVFVSERNHNFCIHANLAQEVGAHFCYVSGPSAQPREHFPSEAEYAHSAFSVPIDKVKRAFESLVQK